MRNAPTSASLIAMIVAVVGAALVGCAANGADPTDPTAADPPSAEQPAAEQTAGDAGSKTPAFEASFQAGPDGGAGTDDSSKDPTPPGGGDQCIDTKDPGGSDTTATKLADTDDCDTDYKDINGVMNGGVDVDYYTFAATDKGVSLSHPLGCYIGADFQDDTAGTELCVYARCQNSTADAVTGCSEGTPATSDIGMQGCCSAAPGRAVPTWNCDGVNDSVNFFMRVRQIDNGNKCLPYKVSYKF